MRRRKFIAVLGLSGFLNLICVFIVFIWFLQTPNSDKKLSAWMMNATYLGSDGVLLQTKPNNCGPIALKMIFDHYHISSTLQEIEKKVNLSKKGSSMLALKEMAELKGLKVEGWKLTLEDFLKSNFPAIIFVNNDHFILADSITANEIYFRDPAIGKIRITKNKLNKIWSGETLIFKQMDKE